MYITVGRLIPDKFNKVCKTATAIANYYGSITTINTTKKPSLLNNDNKDEKQFNIMLDLHARSRKNSK